MRAFAAGRVCVMSTLLVASVFGAACRQQQQQPTDYSGPTAQWPAYGGDTGGLSLPPPRPLQAARLGPPEYAGAFEVEATLAVRASGVRTA